MANKGRRRENYSGPKAQMEKKPANKTPQKVVIPPPDIQKVEKDVLKCIIGQDKPVRQILTSVYRGMSFPTIKSNTLIIGNSGTGKTETIKQIAKRLDKPYTIEDATRYTQEGYRGASVEEMIYNLIANAGGDLKKAQNGILVIDEIDKKKSKSSETELDVAGGDVLKSLLKIIEGTTINIEVPVPEAFATLYVEFNTKNIIVILLGAFSGLDKIRDKRLNRKPIGFGGDYVHKNEHKTCFTKRDLVEYGFPEEFVGRIDTIIEMNKLTEEDLASILRTSKLSVFRKYEAELRRKGITLVYDDEIFKSIAKESLTLDTGARELSNTVNYVFENIIYDVMARPGVYCMCELLSDIVSDNTKYKLS